MVLVPDFYIFFIALLRYEDCCREVRFLRRVTFFKQLKKVTKKTHPYPIAPRETFGVPEFTAIAYEPALMRRPGAQD